MKRLLCLEYSVGRVSGNKGGWRDRQGPDYVCFVNSNNFGLYQPNSFRKPLNGFSKKCVDLCGVGEGILVCCVKSGLQEL